MKLLFTVCTETLCFFETQSTFHLRWLKWLQTLPLLNCNNFITNKFDLNQFLIVVTTLWQRNFLIAIYELRYESNNSFQLQYYLFHPILLFCLYFVRRYFFLLIPVVCHDEKYNVLDTNIMHFQWELCGINGYASVTFDINTSDFQTIKLRWLFEATKK